MIGEGYPQISLVPVVESHVYNPEVTLSIKIKRDY